MKTVSIAKLSIYAVAFISTMGVNVNALGINCRGSSWCSVFPPSTTTTRLNTYLQQLPNNAWFNNGQQIACVEHVCAFLQNTGGANGAKIKQLSPYIPNHGCQTCGSVPYYYPEGNNNVADGELTFNWVSNPCRDSDGHC